MKPYINRSAQASTGTTYQLAITLNIDMIAYLIFFASQTFHRLSDGKDSIQCSDLTIEGVHNALENNVKYWMDRYSSLKRKPTDLKDVKVWDKVGLGGIEQLLETEDHDPPKNDGEDDDDYDVEEYVEEVEEIYEIPENEEEDGNEEGNRDKIGYDSRDEL